MPLSYRIIVITKQNKVQINAISLSPKLEQHFYFLFFCDFCSILSEIIWRIYPPASYRRNKAPLKIDTDLQVAPPSNRVKIWIALSETTTEN